MNIWDILLLAAIGTALFLAVRALIRRKSCGCGKVSFPFSAKAVTAAPNAEKTNASKNRNHKKSKKESTLSACFPFFAQPNAFIPIVLCRL